MPMFFDKDGKAYWAKEKVADKDKESNKEPENKPVAKGVMGRVGKKK